MTALSTVALLLIWQNPYVIMGAGFQMSFLAILSICFFKPVLPRKIPEFLKTVIAVNGGLLLYQMYQFNYVSLVSVLANIPIVYLTGILVPVSLAGFAFFMLAGNLPVIDLLMQSLSFLLLKINSWSTLGGYGAVEVISPSLWFVIGFYFICFFTVSEYGLILWLRKKKKLFFYWILFALLLSVILAGFHYHPAENADLVFIDVGQGDSLHIRSKNKNLLIDGGGSINYNVGQKILKPYLLKNGVSKIDLALATHLHTDHYKGLTELSASFPVKKLETGLTKGRKFKVSSDVIVETLWPIVIEGEKGQEENAQCSVFMIEYNGWKILVTGDLDEDGERKMVEHYKGTDKLSADILKIGHHGSRSSTCDVFLEMVNPSIAVIQVGANNIYGHPDRKVIEKCQKKGIMIVRNDKNGAIGFSFHKKEIKIYPIISYP